VRKRKISDEEREQFETAFREARPLKREALAKASPRLPKTKPGGIDGNTADRLRKGNVEPDARIDLHGMTETVAHRALLGFLRNAQRGGARLVLVITGKGARAPDDDAPFDMEADRRSRGVLKSAVPRWLAEPAFAGLIADHRAAHRRHGGSGALYVYLRKRRDV
jgi:DNA-nicking Smr family endonuclease